MVWSAWEDDDDGRERYTPDEWAEAKECVGEVFAEIDRPNDWLVRLNAEVRGDESGGTAWSFASDLTADQRQKTDDTSR